MPETFDEILDREIARQREIADAALAKLRALEALRPYYSPRTAMSSDTIPVPHTHPEHRANGNGLTPSGPVSDQPQPNTEGDLNGIPIKDAAERILRQHRGWMHLKDIVDEALARGYRSTSSRNPSNDPNKITDSFYQIMKRNPDIFERDRRRFRIVNSLFPDRDVA